MGCTNRDFFFEFVAIDETRKARYAGIYFEGQASIWFRHYQSDKGYIPWRNFVRDVALRFQKPENDAQDQFNKLK